MQDRHSDRQRYFNEQAYTTKKYVIPYLEKFGKVDSDSRVLEIGCGEGGNIKPFLEKGCKVVGIDLNCKQIENAKKYLEEYNNKQLQLICENIYDVTPEELGLFDIVIMRDVIEHIPNQEVFLEFVKRFMHENTLFFLGFPPWQMPFGGHQQVCKNKWLSKLPYYHLLPRNIYKSILKAGGESEGKIRSLMEHVDTGISVERFSRIIRDENYRILDRSPYLINPNYEVKFNLTPRKQLKLIDSIPVLRNFVTTCYYFIISP